MTTLEDLRNLQYSFVSWRSLNVNKTWQASMCAVHFCLEAAGLMEDDCLVRALHDAMD